jgi:hypothetical protein
LIKHPILEDLRRFLKAEDIENVPYDSLARVKVLTLLEALPDDDYWSLEKGTLDWIDYCVIAMENGELPVSLPFITTPVPTVKGRGSARASATKNKENKGKQAHYRIKEIMWDQGVYIEPRKIKEIMTEEGWQVSMGLIQAVKSEFRRSLAFLSEKGLLTSRPKGLK